MVPPELENLQKPRVTEIQVRIDCNGCVQKIKKALHGINGIYDFYIDFPQQKLTIIGWADPEKIVKAIRKSRKTATICSHSEPTHQQAQPTEAAPGGGQPPPESTPPPPAEAPPAEAAPPAGAAPAAGAAPPAEPPKDPPPPENPPPEVAPPPPAADATPSQTGQPVGPKDVEEVHVIYHHPPDYGYRYSYGPSFQGYGGQGSSYPNAPGIQGSGGQGSSYANGTGIRHETPPPIYVAHSYNAYKPSPYVTEFVSPPSHYSHHSRPEPPQYVHYSRPEPPKYMHYNRQEPPQYSYSRPEPPQYSYYSRPESQQYTHYSRPEQYSEDYRNGNGNIASMFSDENPNACRIV